MAIREDVPAARPVTTVVAGVVVTACAVVAGAAAAVPGWVPGEPGEWDLLWEYFWVLWLLLPGLAAAGFVVAARPQWRRPAAVIAMVLAAQVCGHGLVAVRDWFNTAGASAGMRQTDLAWVVGLAAVVAICGTVAGCVATALLWREPVDGWRALRPRKPAYLTAALVVALGLPVALAWFTWDFSPVTMFGQAGLLYGLPWGAGIAAAAWLGRRGRTAALTAVAVSALLVGVEYAVRTLTLSW
ncbi:hypothetical protein FB565_006286 [Actinoplanes lutulentus]|uniref:Uncharacterized protein n=1 Tax=Actinoplanes lutulentus TaxID=1287878 RepID=A0A327Z6B5_9ACTN|nr:hypothetical protein [Actinoplanes lutulentus]MBB2946518.1 hypothetical protein [Actinoplanes lutulentus]RAK26436.1 hypothetical protein B0I29_12726 [Actinoplanes lutulentus]